MPGFNRKGPMNEGPMTGRKAGQCNPDSPLRKQGETTEQTDERPLGGGFGLGRRGRGKGAGQGAGRGQAPRRGMGRGRRSF